MHIECPICGTLFVEEGNIRCPKCGTPIDQFDSPGGCCGDRCCTRGLCHKISPITIDQTESK